MREQITLFPAERPGIIELPEGAPVIVCYGGGVDSTAMLIKLRDQGIIPRFIGFADVGGEKPETYEYVEIMSRWCVANGFPPVTICKHRTLASTPYEDLAGNNTANETLPSLAFGMKSCSIKWKQGPQDKAIMGCKRGANQCDPHPLWLEAQDLGIKPVKLIGYDAGPADQRRAMRLTVSDDNFSYRYPLQQLGMAREECISTIIEEGLPVPIKSACWFCPASQKWELFWLAGKHPELFEKALDMEHRAMVGKHSRWGSDECTYGKDWEEFVNKPADQWPTTSITVGLGRGFAWNHWARVNKIVDAHGKVTAPAEWLLAKADKLKANGGNANDKRTC